MGNEYYCVGSLMQWYIHIDPGQGCQIFLVHYTKAGKNIPYDYKITNAHKIYPMVVKYSKCP
jgi:hypothetical protein